VAHGGDVDEAAHHRSAYMWPWEPVPHSVAGGIIDDETYDWVAVERGVLASGGTVVVVDDALLLEANDVARRLTGIDVSVTGSAGLAGLLATRTSDEEAAVIFTGHD
jgi:threonine synthase